MESIDVRSVGIRRFRNGLILLIAVLLLVAAAAPKCRAQTFAEWFKQKKTQQKYLLEQIAALQVYIGYAKKGYELVGLGIEAVRDITNGEFNLHNAFVSGLKKVNPAIRADVRIAEIMALQVDILAGFNKLKGIEGLRPDQLVYISSVAGLVIAECYQELEELLLVITSGKLEMEDEERLARLDGIYQRMLDKSAFSRHFSTEMGLLLRQQHLEQESLIKLRRYYGID
ncbi:hypothetical protein [Pedobacter borealis]|uniref:hypothetical protein n=1 Tax=Pedobacter borealis TaxID=475254 RepID=UPI0006896970|nr:hypothetical protein [Pedobacter borealis]